MDEETVNRREELISDARSRWGIHADILRLKIVDADARTITVHSRQYGRSVQISKTELEQIVDPTWPFPVDPSWPFQLAKQRIIEGEGFRA